MLTVGLEVDALAVASLRRFREDVREVREGVECGIVLAGFADFEIGDVLVATEVGSATRLDAPALAS